MEKVEKVKVTKEEIYALLTGYFLICSFILIFWSFAILENAPMPILIYLTIMTIGALSCHTFLNATKLGSYIIYHEKIKIPLGYVRPIWKKTQILYSEIQSIHKTPTEWSLLKTPIIKTTTATYYLQTHRKNLLPYLEEMMGDRWQEVYKG